MYREMTIEKTDKKRQSETAGWNEGETGRLIQIDRQTDRQAGRQKYRYTHIHKDKLADRQTERFKN